MGSEGVGPQRDFSSRAPNRAGARRGEARKKTDAIGEDVIFIALGA
jgi:hypothetical protein